MDYTYYTPPPENQETLACRLLSINKIPVATVADSLSTLFTIDNQAMTKLLTPKLIPSPQILRYFGIADSNHIELELGTQNEQSHTYTLTPAQISRSNRVTFMPDSIAFHIKNENTFFTNFYSQSDRLYYILYNKYWSRELESKYGNKDKAKTMPSFDEFKRDAFDAF